MREGLIVKIISNQFKVRYDDGTFTSCVFRKKAKRELMPVVGDHVIVDQSNMPNTIEKINDRINLLTRPNVANIDQAVIVMSIKEPAFSYTLVDRLIFLISYYDIEPIVMLTKLDLANKDEIMKVRNEYQNYGYKVIDNSMTIDDLEKIFANKITVLCGQSGVGKSSFLNLINPSFKLKTQPISNALNRGKHTTRHTELYEVLNGMVVDTPGFSSLDFSNIDSLVLANKIKDFKLVDRCKFDDCKHQFEPNCEVKKGVKDGIISTIRYNNYLNILSLCDKVKEWQR